MPLKAQNGSICFALQTALGLQDDDPKFERLKADLRHSAKKYFDSTLIVSQQPRVSWTAFEIEVLQMYPIFAENHRGALLMRRYIKQGLCAQSCMNRRNAAQNSKRQRARGCRKEANALFPPQQTRLLRSSVSPVAKSAIPTPTISVMPSSNDTHVIRAFLQGCMPSMHHLLPTFIDLGFKTEDLLKGVAKWPKDELMQILERWSGAGKLTWVEAEAIRMGLTSYV